MNFSNALIDKYKEMTSAKSDAAAAADVPHMTRMNLSAIRKGERHLTEEQVIWLATQCQLDIALALVELAAERSKSDTAKTVWANLAKKLKATVQATAVALILLFSHVHEPIGSKRLKHIL